MSLFHRCLAVHIKATTPYYPRTKTAVRMILEAVAITAVFAALLFFYVGFGDS